EELGSLVWEDVHLEAVKPFLLVRSSISKNHKEEVLWLHKDVVTVLMANRPPNCSPAGPVFECVPSMEEFRGDLVLLC
ncbi:MAG TPA: hypothetical protein VF982_03270, partial [Anaerolineales bacterium]